MKKLISSALSALMAATVVSCSPGAPARPPAPEGGEAAMVLAVETSEAPEASTYKIGIITGTVAQGEEEFRAAENIKAKYGDMVITTTYSDDYAKETDALVSGLLSLVEAGARAVVFVQAVPGASVAINKVHETYPDVLVIAAVPGEKPGLIASEADIVLMADELGMGAAIVAQAKKMGAETFVHYSFPRHMSYPMLSAMRDIFKAECEKEGILFVDATTPDPKSDASEAGASRFISDDVPKMVLQYGKETAFFSTDTALQAPLIKAVLQQGARFPALCYPSPYNVYQAALGIEIPEDKKGDLAYADGLIKAKIAENGGTGRFATWSAPVNMTFVEAGVEYASAYLKGETNGRNDAAKVLGIIGAVRDGKASARTYDENGEAFDNFYMVLPNLVSY